MHYIVMEITLLTMENHGIVFLNFCGNPEFKIYGKVNQITKVDKPTNSPSLNHFKVGYCSIM